MGTKISAILFDLDGVIIDSECLYTQFWNGIEEEFPTCIPDFANHIKGTTIERILEYFPENLRPTILQRIYDFDSHLVYPLFPGAEALLHRLKSAGIKTAMVTSSNGEKMEQLYRVLPQLPPCFDVIVNGDMVNHSKPDPEGYLLAANKLGVSPGECIVVEDSLQGMRSGKSAGCTVWGLYTTLPKSKIENEADRLFANISAINDFIQL